MGTPVENLIKVGNKCYWLDPAANEMKKAARKKALKRLFTIISINGDIEGKYKSDDDIVLISDGCTESEVFASELVIA